ncbi:alpha-glucosidase [Reinekea sp.]|jgi:oligo-1,6-glucosidase|uniref:alpha-glucosidase n=1 Tax=Reinekea sp. TaxID=1970455 RepID=UPI00398978DA
MSWWKEGVVYQIYPRSFADSTGNGIGDIQGIISKLDYLQELGVNIVWLNPIYASPNDDNGYDISDYEDIMAEFGTMADFEALLDGLHQRGIKLIMDLVVNHCSDEHRWFVESKENPESPYRDYFFWRDGKADHQPPNNWVSVFSGPAWDYDEKSDQYYLHLFSKKQPDLNWENESLRNDIYAMMRGWFDKGVDGFRMDVINMISKNPALPSVGDESQLEWGGKHFMNGPRQHEFMREMHDQVLQHYDCMTVGECFDVDVEEGRRLVGTDRKELHMIFQMEHMSLDHGNGKWDVQPSWSRVELKSILNRWIEGLDGNGWNSQFWMNHDQPRAVSRFGNAQQYRIESAQALAAVTLTLPGTPYIYMGEEIGMTNVKYPIEEYRDLEILNWYNEQLAAGANPEDLMHSIHHIGRDNARTPMQWNSGPNAGFSQGQPWLKVNPNYTEINVAAAQQSREGIFPWYQQLIALRKQHKTLVYGRYTPFMLESEQVFAFRRTDDAGDFLVLVNLSDNPASLSLPNEVVSLSWEVVMDNQANKSLASLLPWQALIMRTV